MKKILIVIVLIAFVWAVPPLRARLVTASVPVLEKLGPVGSAVINPARNYATRTKVAQIGRLMQADMDEGRPLPEPAAFQTWLRRKMSAEVVLDPWQQPYWLVRTERGYTIGSNGADATRGTEDDVTENIPH